MSYPQITPEGRTVWACCVSSIGICRHQQRHSRECAIHTSGHAPQVAPGVPARFVPVPCDCPLSNDLTAAWSSVEHIVDPWTEGP